LFNKIIGLKKIFCNGLLLLVQMLPVLTHAQSREKVSVNNGWQFLLNDKQEIASVREKSNYWQKINVPHTWNASDIIDDTVGYHQGIGWYKKKLFIPEEYNTKHLELFFEGVCNRATVFINGRLAGEHSGGFTGFKINLDGKVFFGKENELIVKADNGKYLQDSIPPYSGDFNLMGGIYRDVWLVATNKAHFNNRFGNEGILFSINEINESRASFTTQSFFVNNPEAITGSVVYSLSYRGKTIKSGQKKVSNFTGISLTISDEIESPRLWSPEEPDLYQLVVQLKNEYGLLLDELSQNVGFKWVGISSKNEFLLNGKPYKLKGASRHQDYKNIGNALTDAMHIKDIELMKEMGCNFIRIAHYPQDPAIYNACDELGLLAWSEIPVVDKVVDNPVFFKNSENMMREMILQNYNHPSVAIWGYHNEVRNLDTATVRHAMRMDNLAKNLDRQRLTAMAFESNIDAPYFRNPLLKEILSIADINGYNVYQGWYRGKYETIGAFLDTLHNYFPRKPIMLSEYGAGSNINIHSYQPVIFDFSEEYQCNFNEAYVNAGKIKPWMIGFAIWNFIDFQRDGREDVSPNINNKGMVTTDRLKKDAFYYYKSQWSKDPFVYITGKNWDHRIGVADDKKTTTIPLVVYANLKELELLKNGEKISSLHSANGKFEWKVNVYDGANRFLCRTSDGVYADRLIINYRIIDSTLFATTAFPGQLNCNTGQSSTYFTDMKSGELWIPDKPYSIGTWGYVGGKIWNSWPSSSWDGVREGIHKPIANTDNDALFQTFVEGLSAWKASVPDGKYRVSILLCEPFTIGQRDQQERIFTISLNEEYWVNQLNIEKQFGVQTAVTLDKIIDVKKGAGITIQFRGVSGKTILNGVSISKL